MRNKLTLALSTLLALVAGYVLAVSTTKPVVETVRVPYSETQVIEASKDVSIFEAVNDYRVSNGKSVLQESELLNQSARVRAQEIATTGKWSHTRPDGSNYDTAASNWQGTLNSIGENLAKCSASNEQALIDWSKSDLHNKNMLGQLNSNRDWVYIGTATAWDAQRSCMIYVTHFGR